MKIRMVLLAIMVLTAGPGLVGCGNDSTTSLTPDTTPPLAPVILGARGSETAVSVWWNENTEPDLDGYHVYAQQGSSVVRLTARPVKGSYYVYHSGSDGFSSVRVTAVDLSGNESAAASRGVNYAADRIEGINDPADKVLEPRP